MLGRRSSKFLSSTPSEDTINQNVELAKFVRQLAHEREGEVGLCRLFALIIYPEPQMWSLFNQ